MKKAKIDLSMKIPLQPKFNFTYIHIGTVLIIAKLKCIKNNKTEGKKIGNGNAAKLESVLQFNLPYYHSLELHRLCKRVIDNDLHIMSAFQSDPKLSL